MPSHDLGFSDRVLGTGMNIFFISYVALQIPGALLVERCSARRMISVTINLGTVDCANSIGAKEYQHARDYGVARTILLLASLTFLNYFALYSFAFWFPAILKRQSGYSDVGVGLLGAVPYLVTFIIMQVNGWHSDKGRERRWHSAVPLFIAAIGLLGLINRPRSIPLSVVLFAMVSMALAYLPTFWAIPTEILSQSTAAAVGMINAVGSVAGFAGPQLLGYLNTRTESFSHGLGPNDGLRACRWNTDPVYSQDCASSCSLNRRVVSWNMSSECWVRVSESVSHVANHEDCESRGRVIELAAI